MGCWLKICKEVDKVQKYIWRQSPQGLVIEKLESKITQAPGLSNRADVSPPSFFSLGDQSSKSLGSMFQEICLVHDLSISNSKDNTRNQHTVFSPKVTILIWLTQTKRSSCVTILLLSKRREVVVFWIRVSPSTITPFAQLPKGKSISRHVI